MRRLTLFVLLIFDAVTLYQASSSSGGGGNGNSSNQPRLCVSDEPSNGCPPSAICAERRVGSLESVCKCDGITLTFNANYTNDNDYCIPIKSSNGGGDDNASNQTNRTEPSSAASSSSNGPLPSMDGDSNSNGRQLPGAHHVVAGILIPIVLVFVVVGSVFVYKKFHITHRVRNIRRTRRNRPFYEDVMLGSNDNDDPPLI